MNDIEASPRPGLSGQGRDCMVLRVEGMTCGHCANAVQGELAAVPGVIGAEVDLATRTATVVGNAPLPDLKAAVERAGYQVGEVSSTTKPGTAQKGGCGCGC